MSIRHHSRARSCLSGALYVTRVGYFPHVSLICIRSRWDGKHNFQSVIATIADNPFNFLVCTGSKVEVISLKGEGFRAESSDPNAQPAYGVSL